MNIEEYTKSILRTNFNPEEKVKMIQRFTNFEREDILDAIKETEREDRMFIVYGELLKRDKISKRRRR